MVTSYGVGQYAPSASTEAHQWGIPHAYKAGGPQKLVVWCHSAGGLGTEPWISSNNVLPIMHAILSTDHPIISADFSGVAWGNDAAQARVTDAVSYAQTTLGTSAAKVLLMGVSMGGMLALNWARANPTLVAGVALFYPAVNLQAIHDGTGGATAAAASTEAAYGGSSGTFNAAVATHDPAQNAAAIAALGVPMKMWYSTADTVVGTANQIAFAAAIGTRLSTLSLGPAGHADMTQIVASDVAAFVRTALP